MTQEFTIIVDWLNISQNVKLWQRKRALYCILHPTQDTLLYLGRAVRSTVRRRWNAADKHERVWSRMADELGLDKHRIIVGTFKKVAERRISEEMISDVESLLIFRLRPLLNGQSTKTRGNYSRPGMTVHCTGAWPHRWKNYHDKAS